MDNRKQLIWLLLRAICINFALWNRTNHKLFATISIYACKHETGPKNYNSNDNNKQFRLWIWLLNFVSIKCGPSVHPNRMLRLKEIVLTSDSVIVWCAQNHIRLTLLCEKQFTASPVLPFGVTVTSHRKIFLP